MEHPSSKFLPAPRGVNVTTDEVMHVGTRGMTSVKNLAAEQALALNLAVPLPWGTLSVRRLCRTWGLLSSSVPGWC